MISTFFRGTQPLSPQALMWKALSLKTSGEDKDYFTGLNRMACELQEPHPH